MKFIIHTKGQYRNGRLINTTQIAGKHLYPTYRDITRSKPQAHKLLKKLGNNVKENVKLIFHMDHGSTVFRIFGLR
jgi:hypothetical protein